MGSFFQNFLWRIALLFICTPYLLLSAGPAFAQKQTTISFSNEEIERHKVNAGKIALEAANCIHGIKQEHETFFATFGFSKFYGNRIKPAPNVRTRMQIIKNADYVNKNLINTLSPVEFQRAVEMMDSTACVTMALQCLGEGFQKVGDSSTWDKIYSFVGRAGNWYGHELQQALMDLGWTSIYWNPDPANNQAWDIEDITLNPPLPGRSWNSVWGGHHIIYNQVLSGGTYGSTLSRVDDKKTLVGFGVDVPQKFKDVPFFVGIAHQGYHVFPGSFGYVIEAHSMRPVGRHDNIEFAPFNPLNGAKSLEAGGGSPRWSRTEKYRSGLIVVPPRATQSQ